MNKYKFKEYRLKNKNELYNKRKNYLKEYYKINKNKILNKCKLYYQNNKNKIKIGHNYYDKYKTKINRKITKLLRNRIHKVLHHNIKSTNTLSILGCSIDFLKQHLQFTAIKNGYLDFDINDFSGIHYHIDHIIPCSVFNLKCSYHQKLCFNWSNLQILDANKNIRKHNKIMEVL